MNTLTSGIHMRIYTPKPKTSEWTPCVVRPDGHLRSIGSIQSTDARASSVFDENWCIKDGHITREK